MSHINNGKCPECNKIINRYPGFNLDLETWFESLQKTNFEAHLSCAGRGRIQQEMLFDRKATRAHWTQSAHGYNAAIDLWENRNGVYTLDPKWFETVIRPNLYSKLEWLGREHSPWFELPHVQLADWQQMAKNGVLKLVE